MQTHSIKNQEKVLKKLIALRRSSPTQWLYRPNNFEKNFPFIDPKFLSDILAMLEAKEYIKVVYTDSPESFNIETLAVTPKGLDYIPQKSLKSKERWLERLYGFIAGVVLSSVVTYFIPLILDRILGV